MLTKEQIIENANYLEEQGATQGEIQEYLDSLPPIQAEAPPKTMAPTTTFGQKVDAGLESIGQTVFSPNPGQLGIAGDITRRITSPLRALGGLGYATGTAIAGGALSEIINNQTRLAQVNNQLVERLEQLPRNDPNRATLQQAIKTNLNALDRIHSASEQAQAGVSLPGQTIGTGIEGAASVASYLPTPGILGTLQALGPRFIQNSLIFGAQGFGESLEKKSTAGETVVNTAANAIIGPVAAEAVGFISNQLGKFFRYRAEAQTSRAFPAETKKVLRSQLKTADIGEKANFPQKFLDYDSEYQKFFFTEKSARNTIQRKIFPDIYNQWDKIADEIGDKSVNVRSIKSTLLRSLTRLKGFLGEDDAAVGALESIRKNSISWSDALDLRRAIDRVVLPRNIWSDPRLAATAQQFLNVRGELADSLVKVAKSASQELGTRYADLNLTYSLYRTVYDRLLNKAAAGSILRRFITTIGGSGGVLAAYGVPSVRELATIGGAAYVGAKALTSLPGRLGRALTYDAIARGLTSAVRSPVVNGILKQIIMEVSSSQPVHDFANSIGIKLFPQATLNNQLPK